MRVAQALDLISCYDYSRKPLSSLGDFLDPELISGRLAESGTVTLRKRRLPHEMMVWCNVGMALEREEPLHQIVNRLVIMLSGKRPFVSPLRRYSGLPTSGQRGSPPYFHPNSTTMA